VKEMDKGEAIKMIKAAIGEIPYLRTLRYDNQEFKLWRDKGCDILEMAFGKGSTEWQRFARAVTIRSYSSSETGYQEEYLNHLTHYETALKSIVQKHEIPAAPETGQIQAPEDSAEMANHLFDKMQFHPKILEASESLFKTKHYAQAILEAFKAVNNFVKQKTGLALDGKDLMAQVFNKEDPIIKLNELRTQSERDEQEGFRFLFMGAMVGIRNPKAHDIVVQEDPYKTLEYLGFASLLLKKIDFWEAD